ncbi:hypothetical protein GCM10012287_06550 [Streptomyces daqingensis]|uniref:Uncharacterized protein n=1 Tax=Streptomyces daqingensis TaxID=1472640 RepID=A0ABQ2LUL8_9ACTN|nr:hypothetical protein GCM10012287_06550 [Streptomyces daqingensis]
MAVTAVLSPERAVVTSEFGSSVPHPGVPVTSYGCQRPATATPVDEDAAIAELEQCDWDDPLTRLLLLLEIADRPAWLREVARNSHRGAAAQRRAG